MNNELGIMNREFEFRKGSSLDREKGRTLGFLFFSRLNLPRVSRGRFSLPALLILSFSILRRPVVSFALLLGIFTFAIPAIADASTLSRSNIGPTVGLVGWWSFDGKDTLGGTIYDRSGNNNHGSATGYSTSTFYVPGKIGQALDFDGTNDYVVLPDSSVFNPGGAYSACGWVYPDGLLSGLAIISQIVKDDTNNYKWIAGYVTSNSTAVSSYVRIGGVAYSAGKSGLNLLNRWSFLCSTFDRTLSSSRLKIYFNGGTSPGTATAADGDIDSGNFPTIARWGEVFNVFNGKIDDVRIYNRALSASEITRLYTMGSKNYTSTTFKRNTNDNDLVGYWTFDGKDMISTTTAYDVSGNGKTATSFNFSSAGGETGSWTYSTSGPSTFTPPVGVTSVTVKVWGAGGGGGGNSQSSADGGGGGGGGAYAEDNVAVTPGTQYSLYVGEGGTGGINTTAAIVGDDSMFQSSSTVMAKGGALGGNGSGTSPGTGGAGGQAASSFGNVAKWNGGYGESGRNSATGRGGYGGSSAGTGEAGIDTSVQTWSTEVAPTTNPAGSGVGGNGAGVTSGPGSSPASGAGGGGGGSSEGTGNSGGQGANGKVEISYDNKSRLFDGQVSGRVGQAVTFNGHNDYFSVGNLYNGVKTVSFWVKVSTSTSAQSIIDMNGTANIDISSNAVRANNFTGATIYVDGVQTTTLSDMKWHYVVVTATTGVNASAVDIGRISTGYFGGTLDEVKFYSRALSTSEITKGYQSGAPARLSSALPGPENLKNGLVGWWSFDGKDTVGGTIYDRSGNNNHGSALNISTSTFYHPGKIGQALNFDGVNDVVVVTDRDSLDLAGPLSVSFWINLKSHPRTYNEVVIKYIVTANYLVYVQSTGLLCVYVNSALCSTFDFDNGWISKWVHVSAIMTSSANTDIYINGAYFDSIALGYGVANTANLNIGGSVGSTEWLDGSLDDLRIYDRALSASEITQLYNLGR